MKKLIHLFCVFALTLLMSGCGTTQEDRTKDIQYNEIQQLNEDESSADKEQAMISEGETDDYSKFWLKYLDVGQADAALIYSEGHFMLIDGGSKDNSSLIYSVLKDLGVEYLDIVVASHPHIDHIGGLPGAYNAVQVGITLCPTTDFESEVFYDFNKYVSYGGGKIVVPSVGSQYELGPASVKIIGLNATKNTNDTSIILKVQYGDTSFLFTGDAEYDAEKAAIESGADLSADVLKVGHHGSDSSSSYHFIREVMPKVSVISVGKDNEYGHPTEKVLSRLKDSGSSIYRTDLQGDITVSSNGKDIKVVTEKNATEVELMTAGIWKSGAISDEERMADSAVDADYICNENSRKFHDPACESVEKMAEKNKKYYSGSRESLIDAGYEPCGACKP